MAHQGLRHNSQLAGLLLLALVPTALGAGRGLRLQRQPPLAPLLEMQQATQEQSSPSLATSFGPDKCIRLLKSNLGTCVIHVACPSKDVSKVDFSFVCINKGASVPAAQHSYGVGGFDSDEVFDSGIPCDSCTTVDFATSTNGKMVHNEVLGPNRENLLHRPEEDNQAKAPSPADPTGGLAKAPSPANPAGGLAAAPSPADPAEGLAKAPAPGKPYTGVDVDKLPISTAPPSEQMPAFFGPSACVATYLSPQGTCMIQTRCKGVDISNFAIGVTCLDKTGDYTRYIFGKNGFDDEEIFDTTLPCQACIGVGEQPSYQLSGLVPKTIVEDLSSLKSELKSLQEEVTVLKDAQDSNKTSDGAEGGEKKKKQKAKEQSGSNETHEQNETQNHSKHGHDGQSDGSDGHGDSSNSSHHDTGSSGHGGNSTDSKDGDDHASNSSSGHGGDSDGHKTGDGDTGGDHDKGSDGDGSSHGDDTSSGSSHGDDSHDSDKGSDSSSSKGHDSDNHSGKAGHTLIEADVLFPSNGDAAPKPRTVRELLRRLVQKQ